MSKTTINCDMCNHEFEADEYGDNEACDKCGAVYGYEEGLTLKPSSAKIKDASGNTYLRISKNDSGGASWVNIASNGDKPQFSAVKAFELAFLVRPRLNAECITSKHIHYRLTMENEGVSFSSNIKEDVTAYELLNIKTLFESLGNYEYTAEDIKQTMADLGILRHFEVKDNA